MALSLREILSLESSIEASPLLSKVCSKAPGKDDGPVNSYSFAGELWFESPGQGPKENLVDRSPMYPCSAFDYEEDEACVNGPKSKSCSSCSASSSVSSSFAEHGPHGPVMDDDAVENTDVDCSKEGTGDLENCEDEGIDSDVVAGVWGLAWGERRIWPSSSLCRFVTRLSESPGIGIHRGRYNVQRVAVRAKALAEGMSAEFSKRKKSREIFVILPGGMLRRFWDLTSFILLLSLLVCKVASERWESQHRGWMYADLVGYNPYTSSLLKIQVLFDCFFIVDILVNFCTAYRDKDGKLVKDPYLIAKNYAMHWLILDLFCAIPFDYILHIEDPVEQEKRRRTWFGRLTRRTHALQFLRAASDTRPFRGARWLGKIMGHARRIARACGGYSMLWRNIRQILIFVSPRDLMKTWRFLRSVGVIKALALSPVIFRSIFGSFTFLRATISWFNKDWGGAFNFFLRGKATNSGNVKKDSFGDVRNVKRQAKLKL